MEDLRIAAFNCFNFEMLNLQHISTYRLNFSFKMFTNLSTISEWFNFFETSLFKT